VLIVAGKNPPPTIWLGNSCSDPSLLLLEVFASCACSTIFLLLTSSKIVVTLVLDVKGKIDMKQTQMLDNLAPAHSEAASSSLWERV
jgi:hypothetical protein